MKRGVKRIEMVLLLKTIFTIEILISSIFLYRYMCADGVFGDLIVSIVLALLSINSWMGAHVKYTTKYKPKRKVSKI